MESVAPAPRFSPTFINIEMGEFLRILFGIAACAGPKLLRKTCSVTHRGSLEGGMDIHIAAEKHLPVREARIPTPNANALLIMPLTHRTLARVKNSGLPLLCSRKRAARVLTGLILAAAPLTLSAQTTFVLGCNADTLGQARLRRERGERALSGCTDAAGDWPRGLGVRSNAVFSAGTDATGTYTITTEWHLTAASLAFKRVR
jgi:hypothetical protein